MPVLDGVVDLLHRAGLQLINEPKSEVRGHGKVVTSERGLGSGGIGVVLAKDDAVLEAVHEVVPNAAPGGSFDPDAQLTLRLWVVLLCQLGGGDIKGDTGTRGGGLWLGLCGSWGRAAVAGEGIMGDLGISSVGMGGEG